MKSVHDAMDERRQEQAEDADEHESAEEGVERREDFGAVSLELIDGPHPAEAGEDVIANHAGAQRDRGSQDRIAEVTDYPPCKLDGGEEAIGAALIHRRGLEHACD